MWVAIHSATMLGISLYSCFDPKLATTLSFLLSLMFSLQQNWRRRGWNRFCPEVGRKEKKTSKKGEINLDFINPHDNSLHLESIHSLLLDLDKSLYWTSGNIFI
jgi:hypothetical protein